MEKGRKPTRIEEGRRRVVGEVRIERGSNGGIEYEEDPLKVEWCVLPEVSVQGLCIRMEYRYVHM